MKRYLLLAAGIVLGSSFVFAQQPNINSLADQIKAMADQIKALNNPVTPVDCVVSASSLQSSGAWGTCTNGQQARSETWAMTVLTPAANGGKACPSPLSETRTAMQACGVTPPGNGPSITGTSGSQTHGGTLTIAGGRFGSKPSAAPVKYDDFQNLSVGQDVSANGWQTSGGIHPKAATTKLRSGTPYTKNALAEFSSSIPFSQNGDVSNFYLTNQRFKQGYLDAWVFSHVVTGKPGNQKPIRWHATDAGQPNLYLNLYQPPGSDNVCGGRDGVSYNDSAWCTTSQFYENWRHVQYALDIGSGTSASDGTIRVWVDGKLVYDHSKIPVWSGGAQGIPELYLGNYLRTDEGASLQNSWESVYVDNTWARVEIGNNAVYASCTQREIQIPQSWNDSGIAVTVNRGAFATIKSLYLFVIDGSGAVSPGFRL